MARSRHESVTSGPGVDPPLGPDVLGVHVIPLTAVASGEDIDWHQSRPAGGPNMWMHHVVQFKGGYNATHSAQVARLGMELNRRITANGDDWVLGEIHEGLMLTVAIGTGADRGDSYVVVVAASSDRGAVWLADQVSDYVRASKQ